MPVELLLNAMNPMERYRNVPVTIEEESEEQKSVSITELEPKEIGSRVEFEARYSKDESADFLTMAGVGDDSSGAVEQGRASQSGRHSQGLHSMKLQDSLTQSDS